MPPPSEAAADRRVVASGVTFGVAGLTLAGSVVLGATFSGRCSAWNADTCTARDDRFLGPRMFLSVSLGLGAIVDAVLGGAILGLGPDDRRGAIDLAIAAALTSLGVAGVGLLGQGLWTLAALPSDGECLTSFDGVCSERHPGTVIATPEVPLGWGAALLALAVASTVTIALTRAGEAPVRATLVPRLEVGPRGASAGLDLNGSF